MTRVRGAYNRRYPRMRPPDDPFTDVPCPTCGADADIRCTGAFRKGALAHPERVDRVMRTRLDNRLKGTQHA